MPGLIEAAKSSGVTLNDLLLALLLKSLAPLSANRVQSQKRRNISLGTIVNVRKDLGLEGPQIFGLFLGSFIITHSVPEKISIQDLAKDIRVQTLPIKLNKLYLGTPLELAVGRGAAALFSTERRKKFYQKHYPLWGGITNMNLNSIWDQREADRPVDYFRAVSTGPVTPLVLSVTTVRNAVNIGLTYRSTVFSADQIEAVKNVFVGWESQLGGPA